MLGLSDDEFCDEDFGTYYSRFDVPEDSDDEEHDEDHRESDGCHRPYDDFECSDPDHSYTDDHCDESEQEEEEEEHADNGGPFELRVLHIHSEALVGISCVQGVRLNKR